MKNAKPEKPKHILELERITQAVLADAHRGIFNSELIDRHNKSITRFIAAIHNKEKRREKK